MNINESGCQRWGWHQPWWWSVYQRDTPTSPFLTERRGIACMYRNYYKKYTLVLKGPGNATDLNVLQGKANEKPCWPQYIRDQYVLKGPRYKLEMNLNPLSIYICTHCPQVAQRCQDLTTNTGREITMISLGNIALSLKDRVMAFKVRLQCNFSLPSSFSFGSKSFLHLVLLLTWLWSSSSDVGMKNLANSLTREGPMRLRGSLWMSFNVSVFESLLLRRALAFSACTCFLDPISLGCLRGYGGSGTFAAGGAETGLGWFCSCMATCFGTAICCCWSLKLSIWLLIMGWPCLSLVPASKVLKECSISSNSGDVDRDVLADLLVFGLEVFEDSCELLSDAVSVEELSVPLVLVLSALELPEGELGKDTEDSLVVVSVTGCELAGWESLGDGCGSLRSECLVVTLVCLIGMSRSGSVTFSLNSLKPCHLDSSTWLDPPVWHCLWN